MATHYLHRLLFRTHKTYSRVPVNTGQAVAPFVETPCGKSPFVKYVSMHAKRFRFKCRYKNNILQI